MNVHRIVVLAALVASISAAPAGADLGKKWEEKLQEAERLVIAGDYAKAQRITVRVADQMVDAMGPGGQAAKALGVALTLRSLAEAGLGNRRDALWYWHIALNLFPQFAEYDLDRYGAPGLLLRSHPLPAGSPGKPPGGEPRDDTPYCSGCDDRITAPVVRKKPRPSYPSGARAFREQGSLVVSVVISTDGAVSEPRILEALPAPTMSYAALEAVRQWEFEPARLDGEPVAVYYTLTVNFSLRQ
jgi:protein TonB